MSKKKYLGHLLVANPSNPKDELEKSVILVVTHTDNLGIGLQINNPQTDIDLDGIARNLGIETQSGAPIYYGGNMSVSKIHVVHSLDWQGLSTVALNKEIGITNDISVLAAISRGDGPKYYRACSGYWLWDEGRLDIQLDPRNKLAHEPHKWEAIPATIKNVFKQDSDKHWVNTLEECARQRVNEWL